MVSALKVQRSAHNQCRSSNSLLFERFVQPEGQSVLSSWVVGPDCQFVFRHAVQRITPLVNAVGSVGDGGGSGHDSRAITHRARRNTDSTARAHDTVKHLLVLPGRSAVEPNDGRLSVSDTDVAVQRALQCALDRVKRPVRCRSRTHSTLLVHRAVSSLSVADADSRQSRACSPSPSCLRAKPAIAT